MRKYLFFSFFPFFFLIFIFDEAFCSQYLFLEIKVEEGFEKSPQEAFQLIDYKRLILKEGEESFSFQENFTLYVTPTIIDTPFADSSKKIFLSLELFTLGPEVQKIVKEMLVENGKELSLGTVRIKDERFFKIKLIPTIVSSEERRDEKEYDLNDTNIWYSDVSVGFSFHYLKNSLADFDWNKNKGYLESEYGKFEKFLNFSIPTKMEYYLFPDKLDQIPWDDRFNIAIDPVKNRTLVIYSQKIKSVDSPAAWMLMFYQYWGYAPALVVEGLSGSLGLGHWYSKKLKQRNELVPLVKLQLSKDYKSYPPQIAFYEACSFIRFLIDTYGLGKFKRFYNEVTDLTFEKTLSSIYGKSLAKLESEWLAFLDKYSILPPDLSYFAEIKFNYGDYEEAITLFTDLLNISPEKEKMNALHPLANSYFYAGEYKKAAQTYQEMIKIDSTKGGIWNALGNTYYLLGQDSLAEKVFLKAITLDTNLCDSYLKLGEFYFSEKRYNDALDYLKKGETIATNLQSLTEINLNLGEIYDFLGDKEKKEESYKNALDFSKKFAISIPESGVSYLLVGEAYLGLDSTTQALDYLKMGEFLEQRAFFKGKILLALGKTYQKRGDEVLAKKYFEEVLTIPSGEKEKRMAKELLGDQ